MLATDMPVKEISTGPKESKRVLNIPPEVVRAIALSLVAKWADVAWWNVNKHVPCCFVFTFKFFAALSSRASFNRTKVGTVMGVYSCM
jgi:hypothetical protein